MRKPNRRAADEVSRFHAIHCQEVLSEDHRKTSNGIEWSRSITARIKMGLEEKKTKGITPSDRSE